MKYSLFALALLGVLIVSHDSSGTNYFWFTHDECAHPSPNPEDSCDIVRFFGRDTLWGPMRTNGCFAFQNVQGWPTCMDTIVMGCDSFLGPQPPVDCPVIFNAPELAFPDSLTYYRQSVNYYYEPGEEWYISIRGSSATAFHYPEGTELDTNSAQHFSFVINVRTVVFFDGKVSIRGLMRHEGLGLYIGCSRDIRLIDNVMLEGTNMTTGQLTPGATSSIVLASEQNIVIANTWENGRENKTGTPPNNRDIVITAFLYAINGSFTFEQQNDIGDPYICPTPPVIDERGNIVLVGGVTQYERGYVHRSNHGGTGYNKIYHYDQRLRYRRLGVFEPFLQPEDDDIFSDASDPLFPAQFTLAVAPNPFNASTTIRFTLPQASNVRAVVYDVLGREVAVLADRQFAEGSHTMQVDGSAWSSGVYFLSFICGGNASTHKLLLLK